MLASLTITGTCSHINWTWDCGWLLAHIWCTKRDCSSCLKATCISNRHWYMQPKGHCWQQRMGSHKSRLGLQDNKGTDMVMANRHNWATIGKRLPSDWSWLHTELPDIGGGCIAAKVLQKMMALTAIPPNGAVIASNTSTKEFSWCYVPESVG